MPTPRPGAAAAAAALLLCGLGAAAPAPTVDPEPVVPGAATAAAAAAAPPPPRLSFRFIRANGSAHVYFQRLDSPRKHLVRKGMCHMCDRRDLCRDVVTVDPAYVDALETAGDFQCERLNGTLSDANATTLDSCGPVGVSCLPLWILVTGVVLAWVFCCTVLLLAFAQKRGRKKTTRRGMSPEGFREGEEGEEDEDEEGPMPLYPGPYYPMGPPMAGLPMQGWPPVPVPMMAPLQPQPWAQPWMQPYDAFAAAPTGPVSYGPLYAMPAAFPTQPVPPISGPLPYMMPEAAGFSAAPTTILPPPGYPATYTGTEPS